MQTTRQQKLTQVKHTKLYVYLRHKLNTNLIKSRKTNFKELLVCKDLTSLDLTTKYTADYLNAIIADLIPLYIFSSIILVYFLFIYKTISKIKYGFILITFITRGFRV